MGMLGALMILKMTLEDHQLLEEMYKLSQDKVRHFPLCVALLHLMGEAAQLLKHGVLNKMCNELRSVDETLYKVFIALCLEFFRIW